MTDFQENKLIFIMMKLRNIGLLKTVAKIGDLAQELGKFEIFNI